jgi:ribosome-associated protein
LSIARDLVETLEDKKAEDILLIDIHEVAYFADYFIISTGNSNRQLDSLAAALTETAKQKHGLTPKREGDADYGWVVVDMGDIVVHLFSEDQRDYYRLEELWQTGRILLRVQ